MTNCPCCVVCLHDQQGWNQFITPTAVDAVQIRMLRQMAHRALLRAFHELIGGLSQKWFGPWNPGSEPLLAEAGMVLNFSSPTIAAMQSRICRSTFSYLTSRAETSMLNSSAKRQARVPLELLSLSSLKGGLGWTYNEQPRCEIQSMSTTLSIGMVSFDAGYAMSSKLISDSGDGCRVLWAKLKDQNESLERIFRSVLLSKGTPKILGGL